MLRDTICFPGTMTFPNNLGSWPSTKYSAHMDSTMLASRSVQLKNPTRTRPSVITIRRTRPNHFWSFLLPGVKLVSFIWCGALVVILKGSGIAGGGGGGGSTWCPLMLRSVMVWSCWFLKITRSCLEITCVYYARFWVCVVYVMTRDDNYWLVVRFTGSFSYKKVHKLNLSKFINQLMKTKNKGYFLTPNVIYTFILIVMNFYVATLYFRLSRPQKY